MKSVLETPSAPATSQKSAFIAPTSFIALEPKSTPISSPQENFSSVPRVFPEEGGNSTEFVVMALMLTRRCNMSCAHCSVESGPRVKGQPEEEELLQIVRDAARQGIKAVQLTGGEPMLREDLVMSLLEEIRALNLFATLTSNGFWGKSPAAAAQKVKALSDAGITRLTISYDRYHAEFQGAEPAVNIARAFEEMNLPMQLSINFTRQAGDSLSDLVAPFQGFTKLQMRFYDVQAVGRARDFAPATLRQEYEGFCTACCVPTVTDDARIMACNGPSYFSAPESPLFVGFLHENTFAELSQKHRDDPILDTIRTFGPARLRRELQQTPGFEEFPFREGYSGMCDLCLHLTSQPDAMTALHQRLSQPRAVAERFAARRVIKSAQMRDGELNRDFVNTLGACRIFLQSMTQPVSRWAEEAERILGRADFDWNEQANYLASCGLAIPMQKALREKALTRWAPAFFAERLNRLALTDSVRAIRQRKVMQLVAQAVREVGSRGVLLKGTAMAALDFEMPNADIEYSKRIAGRSCCDVDVYIARDKAFLVREKLLKIGFETAECDQDITALHQLPQMTYDGILLEIHQKLQPEFCGLPEKLMLERAQALKTPEFAGLFTLDGEGMLLHSAVHLSKHLFAHSLKTAWDFLWLLDRFPDLDWERVAKWAQKTGMNRGFWVPTRVLCRELSIPFPEDFLQRAPQDKRQQKLEKIARKHLFGSRGFAFQDNPWICQALIALMCDSWLQRARNFWQLFFGSHSKNLRRHRRQDNANYARNHCQKLRDALRKWRQMN